MALSPNSYAQTLDTTGAINAPLSGEVTKSYVSQTSVIHDDSPIIPISRTLENKFSDLLTARDYGMNLEPNMGAQDIEWLNNYWSNFTGKTPIIIPGGAHWPDNAYVPPYPASSKAHSEDFPTVMSFGTVGMRPGFNTPYSVGFPYYGDGIASLTHDDSDFTISRVDGHEMSAKMDRGVMDVDAIYDTPYETGSGGTAGNQHTLSVNLVTTEKDRGTLGNFMPTTYSHGYNYYSEMDVNMWSRMVGHGTNWVWNNIQEMYNAEPFYCDPSDSNLCFTEYMNEEDMYGVGPEAESSAYDPTSHTRMMFWLTTNHNINTSNDSSLRWSANMLVPVHKIITIKNPKDSKEYMFSGTSATYTGQNEWYATGTVSGTTMTITDVPSGHTIVPGKTRVFDNLLTDDIIITAQTSGTTGGVGTYTISGTQGHSGYSGPSTGYSVVKPRSLAMIDDISHARFTTTGSTEPTWTFNTGDVISDGDTQWKCLGLWTYDLGAVIAVAGSNDPSNGYIERIGTVLTEETDYIYNAIIDMSKASFDPSVPYNVFARLQKNMWIDFSASGTQASQNNHILGYVDGFVDSSGVSHTGEFTYAVSAAASAIGKAFTAFMLGDDGTVDFPGISTAHKNTGSHYLCVDDGGGIFKSDQACVTSQ